MSNKGQWYQQAYCQNLRVASSPPEVIEVVRNHSADYSRLLPILARAGALQKGLQYEEFIGDQRVVVDRVTAEKDLVSDLVSIGVKPTPGCVRAFKEVAGFFMDGENGCYGIFYRPYRPLKSKPHIDAVRTFLQENGSVIRVSRPNDCGYCRSLTERLREQLSSYYQKTQDHAASLKLLENKISAGRERVGGYRNVVSSLRQQVPTLGFKAFRRLLKLSRSPSPNSRDYAAFQALHSEEFAGLLKDPNRALDAWRVLDNEAKLADRHRFVLLPKSKGCQFCCGQTGTGYPFRLAVCGGNLVVTIPNKNEGDSSPGFTGDIVCGPSLYFDKLSVETQYRETKDEGEAKKSKKKEISGYRLSFQTSTLLRGKKTVQEIGSLTTAVVKEIRISERDGRLFVYLPHTVTLDPKYAAFAKYFSSADPNPLLASSFPDEVRCMGVDLGLVAPVTVAPAAFVRDGTGPMSLPGYGTGDLLTEPFCPYKQKTPRCREIGSLIQQIYRLKDAVRDARRREFSDESVADLNAAVGRADFTGVQLWMTKLRREVARHKHELRGEGYGNMAEAIRLMELVDEYSSLVSAFNAIHVRPGGSAHRDRNFRSLLGEMTRRRNFRRLLERCVAAEVRKHVLEYKIDVVFVEDLEMLKGNRYESRAKNSLARLFAPGGLLSAIELALKKVGVPVIRVDPTGTSQVDPLTGDPGYRDENNSSNLLVRRDGKVGCLPADPVGAVGVLLKGVSRSTVPFSVYVGGDGMVGKKPEESDDAENERKVGKRVSHYMKKFPSGVRTKFALKNGSVVVAGKKDEFLRNERIYVYGGGVLVAEADHKLRKERIKAEANDFIMDIQASAGEVVDFAIKASAGEVYRGFRPS